MRDDVRPSEDPELRRLQELARRGTAELAELSDPTAERLWTRVRAAALGDTPPVRPPATPARRWAPLAIAAVLALVVGIGIGAGLVAGTGRDEPTPLATIQLTPLTDDATAHTAVLQQDEQGRSIAVDLSDLPDVDGFHEVWLLDPSTGGLVSLGPVRSDGAYTIPDAVDLTTLSVLDVSVEPQDGDPTHSGASVLRGEVRVTG